MKKIEAQNELHDVLQCLRATIAKAKTLGEPAAKDAWYERSYKVFSREDCWKGHSDDLVKALAFAASWVPYIPDAAPSEDFHDCTALMTALDALEKWDDGKPEERLERRTAVLKTARRAFGFNTDSKSVVLLSKALHFLRPTLVPMVDRNVGTAWKGLCNEFDGLMPRSLTNPSDRKYLSFWETARFLVLLDKHHSKGTSPSIGYRDLDIMLFRIGKERLKIEKG